MKVYLTRRYGFSASHRLHNPALSDALNRETYGKCNNRYGHGHNYFLEVTVSGNLVREKGMICDLTALDSVVHREVLDRFDHQNLDTLAEFNDTVPTTENLTVRIQQILTGASLPARLEGVRVEETTNNSFELAPSGQPRR